MATRVRRLLDSRASLQKPQGRRLRTLFRSFLADLEPNNPIHQAGALAAAEMTIAAEDARARLLQRFVAKVTASSGV